MARVYEGRPSGLSAVLGPLERGIYRLCGLRSETLAATALASMTDGGRAAIFNPGSHGFSEVLYAYTSMGNNNGSTFGGLNVNTPFYNLTGGLAMLIGRFWLVIPTLALAGSLARKRNVYVSEGVLPTHTPLFAIWLILVTLGMDAMTCLPALALGSIAVHLLIFGPPQ
jgi:potassium-transporting ATPase potassium-binding subunit